MDEVIGPLTIKRTWNAADGKPSYQIAWTTEQLRRIGQAVEQGDEDFLARIEEAVRRALKVALTPQRG